MQMEGVAILVGLGLLQSFAESPFLRDCVIAEVLSFQPFVDLAEGLLADHA